jgi:hypothetical protein
MLGDGRGNDWGSGGWACLCGICARFIFLLIGLSRDLIGDVIRFVWIFGLQDVMLSVAF